MSTQKSFSKPNLPLTAPIFYILLSLAIKDRHGYEIMKTVEGESQGKIRLGPGTLYSALKHLLEDGLITEVEKYQNSPDERRKYYQLTEKGRRILTTELERLSSALETAKKHDLLPKASLARMGYGV